MNIARDSFHSSSGSSEARAVISFPGTSRPRFVATEKEEKGGRSFFESLSSFPSSAGAQNPSKLSDLLSQAGVPDSKNIEYQCYKKFNGSIPRGVLCETSMTIDDAAIIASFTYQDEKRPVTDAPFFVLNSSLASGDASRIKAVLPYANALLCALRKLKRYVNKGLLYRGIACKNAYKVGDKETWWRISSTSLRRDVAEYSFTGEKYGTIFVISKGWGYDIRPFSFYDEEEIVLDIKREVKIMSVKGGGIQEVCVEMEDTDIVEISSMNVMCGPSEPVACRERRGPLSGCRCQPCAGGNFVAEEHEKLVLKSTAPAPCKPPSKTQEKWSCVWREYHGVCGKYSINGGNPRIATVVGGWYCIVVGNTPLPPNAVTSWSVKVLKSKGNDGQYIFVGTAPSDIDQSGLDYSKRGWYFNCGNSTLWSGPPHNNRGKAYGPRKERGQYVHNGDSVGIVMDTAKSEISFSLNGMNLGVAFSGIPLDKPLVTCVLLLYEGDSVELVI